MGKISAQNDIIDVTWIDANPYCNFVLLKPTCLPEGFIEVKNQIRKETTTVRACHRAEFSDGVRSFSLKQFLYDWAPSAYDHPCLWRNPKIAKKEDTPLPEPYLIGNNYMWVGLDYRVKRSATMNLLRTQVELTQLQGTLTHNEVCEIFEGLNPVNLESSKKTLTAPFARLTHTFRHHSPTVSVPTGYWKYLRDKNLQGYFYPEEDIKTRLMGDFLRNTPIKNYRLDSILLFGVAPNDICEVDYYFENTVEPGSNLHIMVTQAQNPGGIPYPAILSDQECAHETISLSKANMLYHAWSKRNSNGGHNLVFKQGSLVFNCTIKPAPWTSLMWSRDMCSKICEASKK